MNRESSTFLSNSSGGDGTSSHGRSSDLVLNKGTMSTKQYIRVCTCSLQVERCQWRMVCVPWRQENQRQYEQWTWCWLGIEQKQQRLPKSTLVKNPFPLDQACHHSWLGHSTYTHRRLSSDKIYLNKTWRCFHFIAHSMKKGFMAKGVYTNLLYNYKRRNAAFFFLKKRMVHGVWKSEIKKDHDGYYI